MTIPVRHYLRHSRRWLGYGLMVLLIFAAILVAVANQLLPMVERHPDRIAAWLSERVGQRVQFSRARGEWTRRGPRFTLDALSVGEGDAVVHIGSAELLVAVYSGLLPGEPLTELKVRGLSLVLEQLPDRRWHLSGLPQPKTPVADPLELLEGFGELQVEKASLTVRAPAHKLDTRLPRVDLRLRVGQSRLRAGLNVWSQLQSSPMQAVLDLDRASFDGTLWAGGEKLAISQWSPMLASSGVRLRSGSGNVDLWASLRQQRVEQVQLRVDVRDVLLESGDALVDADGNSHPVRASEQRIEAEARWRVDDNGWQMDVPLLRLHHDGKDARLDGLRMRGGKRIEVRAGHLDLGTAASLLALSDRLPEHLRVWLQAAQPGAIIDGLKISGHYAGTWRMSALVSELRVNPVGKQPGISGISGALAMDDRGGALRFSPTAKSVFDWPVGLRQKLDLDLQGTLAWWRNGEDWAVGTPALQVRGDGFGVRVRAELGLQGDGTAPTLDLAAELDPLDFTTAKKFWVMHKMPPATVMWLDDALVQGDVLNGRIVLAGDLDDWPFRHGEGRFDARTNIRGATLHFNPDWPEGKPFDAAVVFNGPGFTVEGQAVLAGNRITSIKGGIADFSAPWLDLSLQAQSDGEKLRALMLASPLAKRYGEHLRALAIAGNAAVKLDLSLPLNKALGEQKISGSLELQNARLADSRWDIAFSGVNGLTRFTEKGFSTENLAVQFEKQPAVFNLHVGETFLGESGLAAKATLKGNFPPQALIRRYAGIQWLNAWLQGSSDWSVSVRIPETAKGREAPPSMLQVNTDLLGTAINLPAPLRKAAASSTSFELVAPLPVEKGEVNLRLGTIMQLRGRMRADAGMNGVIQFGEGAPTLAAVPAQGLAVRGVVSELDVAGWIAFAATGEGSTALRSVDVQASRLLFLDHPFANSRVQLDRAPAVTQMRVSGVGIEGVVDIPAEIAQGVQGRFAKLHFGVAGIPTVAAVQAETDPAKVPPLRFTIDDLRMGKALLGKAELQTSQVPAGMRVDRFRTESKMFGINAAGEWVKAGNGSRSNFKVEFGADSLGKMMDALGFAGMVQGGKTRVTLTGSWPGSPGAFSLAGLAGTLKADIGEGRLLDVEPGGSGRILGLISLAEIPRRLTLDFSDFFAKGFAFNTMKGDFTFSGGIARTDNLHINGPAAEIRVSGNTGLRNQTYDQRVEVLPKAGGVLPALGMLAGGPAGAAVGVMAQAVLQKPLKQTARTVYHITGSWAAPKVEVIEKGPASATDSSSKPTRPEGAAR